MFKNRLIKLYENSEDYFWSTISLAKAQTKDVHLYASGAPDGFLNPAIQKTPLTQEIFQQVVDDIQKFYGSHTLPWVWLIRTSLISPLLIKKKSLILLDQSTAMYCELKNCSLPISFDNYCIKDANDTMEDWAKVLYAAYHSPPQEKSPYSEVVHHYTQAHKKTNWDKTNFYHFVGYQNSVPVTCCTLSIHEQGARIDDVGTIPPYRNKGLGTQMIQHALHKAKSLNTLYCFLEASHASTIIYEKIGFNKLFSVSYFQIP